MLPLLSLLPFQTKIDLCHHQCERGIGRDFRSDAKHSTPRYGLSEVEERNWESVFHA